MSISLWLPVFKFGIFLRNTHNSFCYIKQLENTCMFLVSNNYVLLLTSIIIY